MKHAPTTITIIEYSAPQDEAERQLKQEIEQSGVNDTMVDLSNQLFPVQTAFGHSIRWR
ncbi:hypothetical protein OK016_28400 [Vibrio chagasii]|nr:hypothetical protein [Vibrio chagasii]